MPILGSPLLGDPIESLLRGSARAALQVPQEQAIPEIPYLSPEEEEGILKNLGGKILGGAAYVGSILDKPGRAIRGLLGGQPREILAALPFSDFLGITRPEQQVSGRQLLENLGMLDRNRPGFDVGDIAGFGTELLLDPLTYVGGLGALTKTGKAVAKTGDIAGTLAGRIKAGQAGLASLGLPFQEALTGVAPKVVGTGPASIKAAEMLGGLRKGIAESAIGRGTSALFEQAVGGTTNIIGQTLGRVLSPAKARTEASFMKKAYDATDKLAEAGLNTKEGERMLREVYDGVRKVEDVHPAAREWVEETLADHAKTVEYASKWGADVPQWISKHKGIQYGARSATGELTEKGASNVLKESRRALGFGGENVMTREQIFDVPGGTGMINDMSVDPLLRPEAGDLAARQQRVLRTYLGWDDLKQGEFNDLVEGRKLHELNDEALANLAADPNTGVLDEVRFNELREQQAKARGLHNEFNQAEHLADEMASLPESYVKTQSPLFANAVVKDAARRNIVVDQMGKTAEEAQRLMAREAVFDAGPQPLIGRDVVRRAKKEGFVNMVDAFNEIGLTGKNAQNAQFELLQQAGKLDDINDLNKMWVPKESVDQINRLLDMYKLPEAMEKPARIFDWLNNLFKAGVYAPWPASTVRDYVGGVIAAMAVADQPAKYFRDTKWMRGVLEGTATKADREMMREMAAWGIRPGTTAAGEVVGDILGRRPTTLEDLRRQIPGGTPLGKAIAQYKPKNLRELIDIRQIKGVGPFKKAVSEGTEQIEDTFALVRGGRATKEYSDLLNKGALWKNLRDAGYTPEETWKRVMSALVDYSNLSGFEKNVMKRVFPFYTFTRHMLPFTLQELLHKPGGLWSTVLKAEHRSQQEAGFTPEYLTQGLALPLGKGPTGTTRFLTTLGLPFEAPLELMRGGPGAAQRNLMSVLGQTSPTIKGPLEFATGKQFFSGRDIGELYGITGNQLVDQLLANSPASRLLSSIRTIADPRKSLAAKATNLLTGARISDVDLERARDVAIGDAISRAMKSVPGAKTMKQTFVPKDLRAALNQDQLMLLGLQRTRLKEARERAKEAAAKQ